MNEKVIVCKDCNEEFKLTVGEQEFFKEKGFSEPLRCKKCRQARKNNK